MFRVHDHHLTSPQTFSYGYDRSRQILMRVYGGSCNCNLAVAFPHGPRLHNAFRHALRFALRNTRFRAHTAGDEWMMDAAVLSLAPVAQGFDRLFPGRLLSNLCSTLRYH
jgi:hypothetical protein